MKSQLHPGAKWMSRIRSYWGILVLILFLFVPFGSILISKLFKNTIFLSSSITAVLILVLFLVIISEIYTQMSYNRWFYEFAPDSLKLERGIIWKRYSNIPYEKVQNVDIKRGILARILGFSTVIIQTAGYSFSYGKMSQRSEGYIPAVSMEEAERIRTFLMKKLSRKHDQGM